MFSGLISLQDGSLPAAGIRFFFKQQTDQLVRASWIMEPFGNTLDQLINSSKITAGLVKTYQLALQGLCYLSINNELPGALLSQLKSYQKWLTTVCNHTSMLGLTLDSTINAIEQGTQPEPWFSTSQFDGIIDSRNSCLPQGNISLQMVFQV